MAKVKVRTINREELPGIAVLRDAVAAGLAAYPASRGTLDLEVESDTEGNPVYRRVIRSKPNPNYDAGDRTGRLPGTIDLDYEKFVRAFEG